MDSEERDDLTKGSVASFRGGAGPYQFLVPPEKAGIRVDQFLVLQISDCSRSQIISALKKGSLLVDGQKVKASYRVREGESVAGHIVAAPRPCASAQYVDFKIIYEDEFLIGLIKPPGLVVHPADGNPDGTLVNGLLYHCKQIEGVGDSLRPGIVHRLDKDTSGVMVVAKTEMMHRSLVDLFKARGVHKRYHALVVGHLREQSGRIVAPIGRHPVNRKKMAVREPGGRYAATRWQLEEAFADYSLISLIIETGRTHQIRVHMASLGHPVAGDGLYGKNDSRFGRQMLHASSLSFIHPVTGHSMDFEAPLWPDMGIAVAALREGK